MNLRILSLAALLFVVGCASNPMVVSSQQELQALQDDEAQVVFMRSSYLGSAINASLFDVTDGDIKFIGIIADGTKVPYKTEPGKRVFMVVSEAADFMEADLSAGKNYFGIATPRMGAWVARFSLWPIKNDPGADYYTGSTDFENWVDSTKLVENSEKSLAWYEKNKNSVQSKYDKYWPAWMEKTPEELARRTLLPEDGI